MGYGRHCCIPNCNSNDDPDYIPKVGFLQFPTLKRDDYVLWKANLIDVLKRYRILQPEDYERIENGKMFICTLHFEETDMYLTATGRKKVDVGALPKLNLPTETHDNLELVERQSVLLTVTPTSPPSKQDAYECLKEIEDQTQAHSHPIQPLKEMYEDNESSVPAHVSKGEILKIRDHAQGITYVKTEEEWMEKMKAQLPTNTTMGKEVPANTTMGERVPANTTMGEQVPANIATAPADNFSTAGNSSTTASGPVAKKAKKNRWNGKSCCIPLCDSPKPRTNEEEIVKHFVVSARKGEFYESWRKSLVHVISKYRILDKEFYRKLERGEIWICERHFAPEDIERNSKTGKKEVRLCVVPTINLPVKSHDTPKPPERRPIIRNPLPPATPKHSYKNFNDLVTRTLKLKLNCWKATTTETATATATATATTETTIGRTLTTETTTSIPTATTANHLANESSDAETVTRGETAVPVAVIAETTIIAIEKIQATQTVSEMLTNDVATALATKSPATTEIKAKTATFDNVTTTVSQSTLVPSATAEITNSTEEISAEGTSTEATTSTTEEVKLYLTLTLDDEEGKYRIPKFEIYISEQFEIFYYVFGYRVPMDNEFVRRFSLKDSTVSTLISDIQQLQICQGVREDTEYHGILHTVPCNITIHDEAPFSFTSFRRPDDCMVLMPATNDMTMCKECYNVTKADARKKAKMEKLNNTPAHPNAPLTQTHPKRIALALKEERKKTRELEEKLQQMEGALHDRDMKSHGHMHSGVNPVYVPMIPMGSAPPGYAPGANRQQIDSEESANQKKGSDDLMETEIPVNPPGHLIQMVPMHPMFPPNYPLQQLEKENKMDSHNKGTNEGIPPDFQSRMVPMVPVPHMYPPAYPTPAYPIQQDEKKNKEITSHKVSKTLFKYLQTSKDLPLPTVPIPPHHGESEEDDQPVKTTTEGFIMLGPSPSIEQTYAEVQPHNFHLGLPQMEHV